MNKLPLQVAVIGVGRFGEQHARAFAESPLCDLVAVADADPERAREVARRYGAPRHCVDYRELLDDPQIDAVSIATPAHLHAAPAIAAATSGKHILLEKPIAATLEEALSIVRAARQHGVLLMMGQILRFETNLAAIQSAIAEGAMGRPTTVVARFNNPISEAQYSAAVVSPLLHLMTHIIDLALWYLERPPVRVFCAAARGRVYEEMQQPDGAVATIEFEGGALAVLESFWCLPEAYAGWDSPHSWNARLSDVQVEVLCTKGALYLDPAITSLRACDHEGWKFPQTTLRPAHRGALGGAFEAEISHFLTCCLKGTPPLVRGEEGLAALQIALGAEQSLATGEPVALAKEEIMI